MRSIAIIGAGYNGLLAAHALNQKGYQVTLFSDKSPKEFLENSKPSGLTARFHTSLEYEKELGLNFWDDVAPWFDYSHISLCEEVKNRLMTTCCRLSNPAQAVDLRLMSATWMEHLDKTNAQIQIGKITMDRLEEISNDHDLTILAAGRKELRNLFERDEKRSHYTEPQRKIIALGIVGSPMQFDGAPGLPVKFNIFPKYGELFWLPWYHKSRQLGWGISLESKSGTIFDRLNEMQSGEEILEGLKDVVKEYLPWDYKWIKSAELADENAWISGSILPEVRKPYGTLPSGNKVMALGDTAISYDPVCAQGANSGNRMVQNLVDGVVENEDKAFNQQWMIETFDKYWEKNHWASEFTRVFLDPMTDAGKEIMTAAYGSTGHPEDQSVHQQVADLFAKNFEDPSLYTKAFKDSKEARKLITEQTGKNWRYSKLKNFMKIGKGQFLQKMGKDPRHPSTAPY